MKKSPGLQDPSMQFMAPHDQYIPEGDNVTAGLRLREFDLIAKYPDKAGGVNITKELIPPMGRGRYGMLVVSVSFSETDTNTAPYISPTTGGFASAFEFAESSLETDAGDPVGHVLLTISDPTISAMP